jgi:predicted outer membrane repeat protein
MVQKKRVRLQVESLEDRLAPAVYVVTGLADGVGTVTPAGAGTFHASTLRAAITAVNNSTSGTNNTIDLAFPGTYKITLVGTPGETDNAAGEFAIIPSGSNGSSLVIQNTSGGMVTMDGNHLNRVFDINPSDALTSPMFSVTMTGFTITNGVASPGDAAAGSGGGIRDQNNVNLTLNNMIVTNNSATADGGGLVMDNTASSNWTLTINNSTISNNHAGDAGGGIDTDGPGTVIINTGSMVTGNTDLNQGAGIYIDAPFNTHSANLTMMGTIVSNNQAINPGITSSGGGISNAGDGLMTIINSTVSNNVSGGNGGGFSDENNLGSLIVLNSYFLNNTAVGNGGGIQEGGPQTDITNTLIQGNSAGGMGGGLFANGTTLVLQNSTIAKNTSANNGGGIELATTGAGLAASTITNTTISGNQALNNADVNGGGIDAEETGDLVLQNDTINANFGGSGGGVFWAGNGTLAVRNTIMAANTIATDGAGPDANNPSGTFTDNGGNLIGISGAGSGNSGFTAPTTQTGTVATPLNPLLGALTNNGGPLVGAPGAAVPLPTEALLVGSPAFGKGILFGAPSTDERGFPSVVNGKIDVGAISNVPTVAPQGTVTMPRATVKSMINGTTVFYVTTTADIFSNTLPTNGILSLRTAIQLANATAGNVVIDLMVPGTYSITRAGTVGETDNMAGEFAIFQGGGTNPTSLMIQNTSGGAVTVDGNHLNRVFDINPNNVITSPKFSVTMTGFTITSGVATPGDGAGGSGGGIRDQNNVSLTLTNMTLKYNIASADGGGLVMFNTADSTWKLTITNSTISNNHAGDAGGGIDTDGAGTVDITGSVISGNTDVNQGAGVYIDLAVGASPGAAGANMTMIGTIVSNNDALASSTTDGQGGSGGGISNAGTGLMKIVRSTISENFAAGSGGGFDDENGFGTLDVEQSLFINNTAILDGGAIHEGGTSTLIKSSEIKGNSSGGVGGGIFADGTTLTLQASTIADNTSAGGGGGIEMRTSGTGTRASTITNSTIARNKALFNADVNGGGIDDQSGDLTLLNDTINANFGGNGGGVFWVGNNVLAVQNTIIAANIISGSGAGTDVNNPTGTITDHGGNLIGISGPGSGNSGFTAGATQAGTVTNPLNPLLGPLANNGGPMVGSPGHAITLETEALLMGSKAIDKGVSAGAPNTDERGMMRPDMMGERPDIGAYESQS